MRKICFVLFCLIAFIGMQGCSSSKASASIYQENGLINEKGIGKKDNYRGAHINYQYTCDSKQKKAKKKLRK